MNKNHLPDLFKLKVTELKKIAKEMEITDTSNLSKTELIHKIFETKATQEGLAYVSGCLEVTDDGYGFLRFTE
ncbi:MAG: Rho termination factor N-terminal domain-containing protein, partial [Candidatus Cloacimonadota bacterium]|nr:Rho termination factor N-terminal domain-containing protein [Candidatus Cloacimonadota bacterium]